ncbi:MAG: substrate-binding domain-containing protein [Candidatus Hadarchaeum sp.]
MLGFEVKFNLLSAVLIAIALTLSLSLGAYRGQDRLIVSTTTSLYDAGLLDFIAERYFELYHVKLDFIASGTGQALELAKNGDVDVVLTHSPALENKFLKDGVVGGRKIIAYNFFIIVGPPDDPANIEGLPTIEALTKIAALKVTWVSRGDNSGTHLKEKILWEKAGIEPYGQSWYIESGSGMGQTLGIATEKRAYTLTDTGTYLRYQNEGITNLDIIIKSGEELLNVYSVMAVNPKRNPGVNFDEALNLIKFLVSDAGQALIKEFGMEEYGTSLFLPAVPILRNTSDPIAGWIRDYAFIDNSECPPEFRLGQEELYQ